MPAVLIGSAIVVVGCLAAIVVLFVAGILIEKRRR